MRLKVVRVQLDDERLTDLMDYEALVNETCEDLEAKGFRIKNIDTDRFRNKITAFIKYRKPIWGIL